MINETESAVPANVMGASSSTPGTGGTGGGGNAAFQVTAAGTEGQVLTASATGVPQFSMISGGTF